MDSQVLVSRFREEDIAGTQFDHVFPPIDPMMHVHRAVQGHEDLLAVVDVPATGLVGPVNLHGQAR